MDTSTHSFSAPPRRVPGASILLALVVAMVLVPHDHHASAQNGAAYRHPIPAIARDGALPTAQSDFATSVAVHVDATAVTFTITVTSEQAMTALVDLEVFAPDGTRALQRPFFDRPLTASAPHAITTTWSPGAGAPPGAYVAKVGIFAPGWDVLYHWNDNAATFTYP